jgi:ADP-heptose:LPS heptosyltransferase
VNLLVLRALGIGDLAAAVPALRGLRRAYPSARIDLAVPAWLAPLARLTGAVDSIVDAPGLVPLRVPAPDVAVNLHGRGPQSHRILRELAPGRVLAFACPAAGHNDGPEWNADPAGVEHEVLRWCRLLAWYGIACNPGDLALTPPDEPAPVAGATVVHPGAKAPHRRWPPERFAAVARVLEADGHKVVISGSPADTGLAARVAGLAGLATDRVLAGRTDVGALAALVAAARLVISGDTGIAHLATGYGTPSVVLFGPVSPAEWGPPRQRRHQSLWRPTPPVARRSSDAWKSPPGEAPSAVDPALLALSAADVLSAAHTALTARA